MITTSNLREYILLNYNQEVLYSIYLNTPLEIIEDAISNKRNILNTHRGTDTDPSLSLFYKDYKLRMWDHGNMLYRGDIFDLVGITLGLNSNDSVSFVKICKHIMDSAKMGECVKPNVTITNNKVIKYRTIQYNKKAIHYWYAGGVILSHLNNRGVLAASNIEINGLLYHNYTNDDPAFIYILGYDKYELCTIYRPFANKKDRFRKNSNIPVEGINELYSSKYLIITKSRKDKLVLESTLDNGIIVREVDKLVKKLNIPPFQSYPFSLGFYLDDYKINSKYCITNLSSESTLLSEELIAFLKSKHKHIIINYDYDLAGIFNSFFYYKVYNFIPVFIGRNKDIVYNNLTDKLIELLINKIKEYEIDTTEEEIRSFIDSYSGEETAKDWYELSIQNINYMKQLANDKFGEIEKKD